MDGCAPALKVTSTRGWRGFILVSPAPGGLSSLAARRPRRPRVSVDPRSCVLWAPHSKARKLLGSQLPSLVGFRQHTSVCHAGLGARTLPHPRPAELGSTCRGAGAESPALPSPRRVSLLLLWCLLSGALEACPFALPDESEMEYGPGASPLTLTRDRSPVSSEARFPASLVEACHRVGSEGGDHGLGFLQEWRCFWRLVDPAQVTSECSLWFSVHSREAAGPLQWVGPLISNQHPCFSAFTWLAFKIQFFISH